jgi:hypothetical protein
MPSNYEEQIALQGTLISRPESPALEGAAANAIEEAFPAKLRPVEVRIAEVLPQRWIFLSPFIPACCCSLQK